VMQSLTGARQQCELLTVDATTFKIATRELSVGSCATSADSVSRQYQSLTCRGLKSYLFNEWHEFFNHSHKRVFFLNQCMVQLYAVVSQTLAYLSETSHELYALSASVITPISLTVRPTVVGH